MKLKQITLSAAFAFAMAFGVATTPSMATSYYPSVQLSLSGTLTYSANNDTKTQGAPLRTVSYTSQTLISLLNASSTASNRIFLVTGKTSIPAGSYFLWNPDTDSLTISNANGFSFPLDGSGYDFGYLEVDYYQLIGTYTLAPFTLAGTETDKTGIYFYFDDESDEYNEIELYGTATLNWTYGAAKNDEQTATLSVTMTGCGNDDCYVDDYNAIPATFSATGTGSSSTLPTDYVPFFYEY
jgi:hypothetical protein